ncbi:MAG: CdaR family protein [Anaerolineaceae bacterium]|nr:CdaR family protein [Anaerolineaceae bacterium]
MKSLRDFLRFLPTVLLSIALAFVVWVAAVTETDPNETINYSNPVQVKVIGLDPGLIISKQSVNSVVLSISAPHSIHNRLSNNPELIQAFVNLSGKPGGDYSITPQIDLKIKPAKVTRLTPQNIEMTIEPLSSRQLEISLRQSGSLPIGYEASTPELSDLKVKISGPLSQVQKVTQSVALLDISNLSSNLTRTLSLHALDIRGAEVTGINLEPAKITVSLPVKQLGGYRNVFVKILTTGNISPDFYLTGIVANPPNITIYATDPEVAKNMPSFIETVPIDLNGANLSFASTAALNLPQGIQLVGEQTVSVQVGLAPVESSRLMANLPVKIENLAPNLKALISPQTINVYVSGPIYILNQLIQRDLEVTIDLEGKTAGTYQLAPQIKLPDNKIKIDSTLPGTLEVVISK